MATGNLDLQISITNAARANLRAAIRALWEHMTPYERARSHLRPVVDRCGQPLPAMDYCGRYADHVADCRVMARGGR